MKLLKTSAHVIKPLGFVEWAYSKKHYTSWMSLPLRTTVLLKAILANKDLGYDFYFFAVFLSWKNPLNSGSNNNLREFSRGIGNQFWFNFKMIKVIVLFVSLLLPIGQSSVVLDKEDDCRCQYHHGRTKLLQDCENPRNSPFAFGSSEYKYEQSITITEIHCVCLCLRNAKAHRSSMTLIRL